MKYKQLIFAALSFLIISCSEQVNQTSETNTTNSSLLNEDVIFYLTTPDQSVLFQQQTLKNTLLGHENLAKIKVSTNTSYQEIDGFGFSLTGGSAELINAMSADAKNNLLNELFGTGLNDIGVSYLRISLGASDLDAKVFSYNDLPLGESDIALDHFSIDEDKKNLIPVLQQILAINPEIKIMASPWSAPTWMKTNNASKGGSLKAEYYDVYAQYFVKYIQAMQQEGIIIDAITVQNEPLHPGNNPSLYMEAADQAVFVKSALGPSFKQANLATKIIIYDHNADRPDYPIAILDDEDANQYIDGSAFHLYGGKIEALNLVHQQHPDKNIYFTEQWIGAPGNFPEDIKFHTRELIIGATRNWSKTVLEWNLAADPNSQPHTDGGCTRCLGGITLDGDQITRNPAYYIIAHAAKHVRPGSVRVTSNSSNELPNVAFKTPAGEVVVIIINNGASPQHFSVDVDGEEVMTSLAMGAVATLVFQKN